MLCPKLNAGLGNHCLLKKPRICDISSCIWKSQILSSKWLPPFIIYYCPGIFVRFDYLLPTKHHPSTIHSQYIEAQCNTIMQRRWNVGYNMSSYNTPHSFHNFLERNYREISRMHCIKRYIKGCRCSHSPKYHNCDVIGVFTPSVLSPWLNG